MNLGKTYHLLLQEIKHKISSSRLEAIQAVNRKLIHLYREIGKLIHQKQAIRGGKIGRRFSGSFSSKKWIIIEKLLGNEKIFQILPG